MGTNTEIINAVLYWRRNYKFSRVITQAFKCSLVLTQELHTGCWPRVITETARRGQVLFTLRVLSQNYTLKQ